MGHYHESLTENCHNVSSLLACVEKKKHLKHGAKSFLSENKGFFEQLEMPSDCPRLLLPKVPPYIQESGGNDKKYFGAAKRKQDTEMR